MNKICGLTYTHTSNYGSCLQAYALQTTIENIKNASVEEGSKLTKPADPTKDGFAFDGWYTDSGLNNPMDFNTPITGKLDLYAKWKAASIIPPAPNEYTVSFETNGGSTIVSVTVEEGSKVTKPADPTKDGYKFVNWYTDIGLSTEMNFDNAVTSTLTLYAKWEKVDDGNYGIVDRDFKIPCDVKFSTEAHTSANQTTIDLYTRFPPLFSNLYHFFITLEFTL